MNYKFGVWHQTMVFEQRNLIKLDGVGPVDNRPSTDKLHHFVQKIEKKKKKSYHKMTGDTLHVTGDT